MRRFLYCFLHSLLGIASTLFASQNTLEQQIKKLIKNVPGQAGVAALHLGSGQRIEVNGNIRFPLLSTYKIPIALCCLSKIDSGTVNLHDKKKFTEEDLRRGCNIFSGQSLSIEKIIRLMLEKSDNAASDMILKMVGGGKVVTDWLGTHGIKDMRIDRSTLKMAGDISGITLDDDYRCSIPECIRRMKSVSHVNILAAQRKFFDDQRDTTTPHAMVDLLAHLYRKELVNSQSTDFILDCMTHCHVFGKGRIPRLLPKTCKVWHKTGRADSIVADVGIIELPRSKGHIVIALYSNKDTQHEEQRELAMAKITRTIYDHFSK
jgi:beta-lactamase class A